jgi:uncharacterized protein
MIDIGFGGKAQQFITRIKLEGSELTSEEKMLAGVIKRAEILKANDFAFLIKRQRDTNKISMKHTFIDNVIVKPVGENCNLRCTYCYELNHAKQENILRTVDKKNNSPVMKEDILEEIISKILSLYPLRINFSWHGGEPLLAGIDFYENVVNLIEKYRKPGQEVKNSIQTNGTLINDTWITFFQKNSFIVGVSLDGPKELHDQYRRYPNGKGTHKDVTRGINKLKKSSVTWGIIGVMTSDTNPELFFDYFIKQGIFEFYTNLRCDTEAFLSREEYLDYMIKIFDCWLKSEKSNIRIEFLDNIIWGLLGYTPRLCFMDKACNRFITIGIDGDVAPGCSLLFHYYDRKINVKDPRFPANLIEELSNFSDDLYTQEEEYCSSCELRRICHGGCSYNKILRTKKVRGKDYYCEAYQKLFKHISEKIDNIIIHRLYN